MQRSAQDAFTLLEMMAVVLILGLIMSVMVVNVMKQVEIAKVETTRIKMRNVEGALDMFMFQWRDYPPSEPGLVALLGDPAADRPSARAGLLRDEESIEDAWQRRFGYASPGAHRPGAYDLWSNGRDGATGGDGVDADIVNWEPRPKR
jgi:general secretion pathway protein G